MKDEAAYGGVSTEAGMAAEAEVFRGPVPGTPAEPIYTIKATGSVIRKLARLSSEANAKLRAACPQAFVGNVVMLAANYYEASIGRVVAHVVGAGPAITVEQRGPYKGLGLRLDSRYEWAIEPVLPGSRERVLVARERLS